MEEKKTLKDYLVNVKDYISNIPKGVKIAIAAGTLFGIVSTATLPQLHAEEVYSKSNEDGWKIEATVDVVPYNVQLQGLEEKMGASGEAYEEWSDSWGREEREEPPGWDNQWEETDDYGTELNPIKVDPTAGTFDIPKTLIKPRVSLYTPSKIGFHAEGWQLSGNALESDKVPGMLMFIESSVEDDGNHGERDESLSTGLVFMWDYPFGSSWFEENYTYDHRTGEWSWEQKAYPEKAETKYECSRNFKLLNGSLFASIPLVPTLRALGGLRGQFFEINDMQRVQTTFHREYTGNWYNESPGQNSSKHEVYHTDIDSKVNSSIKGQGLGPMVGLMGSKNITNWLRVYGDFSKSWIRLKTERTADFSEIRDSSYNDLWQVYDLEGNLIYEEAVDGTTYLEGKVPFTVEQTHNLSQTEFNIGLEFLLGKHITLSGGYWKNIMQSIPKPAKFNYMMKGGEENIGDLSFLKNLWEYEVEAKDISAQGFKVGAGIKY